MQLRLLSYVQTNDLITLPNDLALYTILVYDEFAKLPQWINTDIPHIAAAGRDAHQVITNYGIFLQPTMMM